jgi:transcriptional regulator with XRE-family HTH domain
LGTKFGFVNRGAEELARLTQQRGEQQRLAAVADLDEGYMSRITRGVRIPGLDARRKLEAHAGIPMQWWDEPATEKQLEDRAQRDADEDGPESSPVAPAEGNKAS